MDAVRPPASATGTGYVDLVRSRRIFMTRIYPAVVAAAVLLMLNSNVGATFLVLPELAVNLVLVAYAVVLAAIVWNPNVSRLHVAGGVLGVFVFAGRGGAFLEVMLDSTDWSLTAAVLERAVLALSVFLWHNFMAHRASTFEARYLVHADDAPFCD